MKKKWLIENKLCRRSQIKTIDNWTVTFVRYSGPFLNWIREEKDINDNAEDLAFET